MEGFFSMSIQVKNGKNLLASFEFTFASLRENLRLYESLIAAQKMNVMRRNDDATRYYCRLQKIKNNKGIIGK